MAIVLVSIGSMHLTHPFAFVYLSIQIRGWSPTEIEQMDKISQHVEENDDSSLLIRNVSLGPQVLRAETAAITAVAAIMMHQDYAMNKNQNNP